MTEQEVRELRDKVYGRPVSDKEWLICREHWLKPEEALFLVDQALKQDEKYTQTKPGALFQELLANAKLFHGRLEKLDDSDMRKSIINVLTDGFCLDCGKDISRTNVCHCMNDD